MVPYIIIFILSIGLISLGIRMEKYPVGKLLQLLGLLLPCLMAGLRSVDVGTDTKGYIYNLYRLSIKAHTFSDFLKTAYNWYLQSDVLYLAITYIFGKNLYGFKLLLFVYECLIIFPIYIALKKTCKNRKNIIIGLLSFYLLLYNVSFNMLRQCISIAFIILAFSYYIEDGNKHKLLPYVFLLVAYGFHSTSIIVLLIFILYKMYTNIKISNKFKFFISYFIVLSVVLFVFAYKQILLLIGNLGIYRLALFYIDNHSSNDLSFYQVFINILILFMIIVNKKNIKNSNISYKFLLILALTNLLVSSVLGYHIQYSQRIMLYLQYILVFLYIPRFTSKTKNSVYTYTIYIALLMISWYLYFAYMNVNETVPYVLGI